LKLIFIASLILDVASEFVQFFINSERAFDKYDILANVVGSGLALGLCAWYHRRMVERKRQRKLQGYGLVAGGEGPDDLELGEGGSAQELGVVPEVDEDDGGEAWDDIGGGDSMHGGNDDSKPVLTSNHE